MAKGMAKAGVAGNARMSMRMLRAGDGSQAGTARRGLLGGVSGEYVPPAKNETG